MVSVVMLQLPQMTQDSADESRRSKCFSFVLDVISLSLGVVIMTFIAVYENNIQLLLADQ